MPVPAVFEGAVGDDFDDRDRRDWQIFEWFVLMESDPSGGQWRRPDRSGLGDTEGPEQGGNVRARLIRQSRQ
jgi:hypothetical protein